MFKRLFNIFKRDKPKVILPVKVKMEMPKPKEIKKGFRFGNPIKFIQRLRGEKLKKNINKGLHIAQPKHCTPPMKPLPSRTDMSASADLHIDRIGGAVPCRKPYVKCGKSYKRLLKLQKREEREAQA